MKLPLFSIIVLAYIFISEISANNLQISNVSRSNNMVTFDILWDNSWYSTSELNDAAWVFVKQVPNGSPAWIHANISIATTGTGYHEKASSDNVGVIIRRSSNGNGAASTTVSLTLSNLLGAFQDIKVFATEMVYVPQGGYSNSLEALLDLDLGGQFFIFNS